MNLVYFFVKLCIERFRIRCGWPEEQSSFPSGLFPTGLVIKFLYAACPAHYILHNLSTLTITGEE
jgi:hypothetical protein